MTRTRFRSAATMLLALAATLLTGALAVAQPAQAPDDPPIRVGRVSHVDGNVSYSPAGNDEWVHAQVNRPVVTGDRLWADERARAEMTIDNSTWWLGAYTSVSVSNLDDRIAQFQLQQGTLDFRVRRMSTGNIVEVDTPNLAFTVTRPGRYRVEVNPQDGATTVIVRDGAGDVYGENASYVIANGQAYRFYGTDLRDSEFLSLPPPDPFERWVAERDRRYERSVTARYLSPEVVGYEDLDTYGSWTVEASYGNVWFPHAVQAGWAPYRYGHWAWIDPWGWTWVDDAPWGFAPFHYGRWAYLDRGWGWIPGPRTVRPVYAPALVAFVGGAGFSVAVSSGPAIGWFPLGPREVYRPPYRVSRDYFRQVNVSNTVINQTNITNIYNNYERNTNVTQVNYVNMRAPNAVTAVAPAAFAQSQNVGRAAVALPAAAIARAEVQTMARVAPARAAMMGAAPVAQAKPPAAVVQRTVVAKSAPPPPPVPDAQKLQALERNPGQPLTRGQLQQLRQATQTPTAPRDVRVVEQPKPAASAAPPARPAGEGGPRRAQEAPGSPATGQPPAAAAPGAPAAPPSAGAPSQAPVIRGETRTPGAAPPERGVEGRAPQVARPPETQRGASRPAEPPGQERAAQQGQPPVAAQPGRDRVAPPPGQERAGQPAVPPSLAPPGQERTIPPARERAAERPATAPPAASSPQVARPPEARGGPVEARGGPAEARGGPPGRAERGPQGRPEPSAGAPAARPPETARSAPRDIQPERAPEPRPAPQSTPPQRGPEARAAPPQRAPEAAPQTAPRGPEARPAPPRGPDARLPEARPQPQTQPPPQARPQPQPQPQPQARPQPQPQPQAQPQPPQSRGPEAQGAPGGSPRGQQERPQGREERGKGNEKGNEKGKDKDQG